MTNEELLKPRYRVTALYPNSYFKIGDILTTDERIPKESVGKFINDVTGFAWVYQVESFPHIFKKLEWWEGWKKKDLPKYVKNIQFGTIRKVVAFIGSENELVGWEGGIENTIYYTPATEEEFNSFQNSKP